ncbi:unnamed protein product, partial [Laminaria digitata]
ASSTHNPTGSANFIAGHTSSGPSSGGSGFGSGAGTSGNNGSNGSSSRSPRDGIILISSSGGIPGNGSISGANGGGSGGGSGSGTGSANLNLSLNINGGGSSGTPWGSHGAIPSPAARPGSRSRGGKPHHGASSTRDRGLSSSSGREGREDSGSGSGVGAGPGIGRSSRN